MADRTGLPLSIKAGNGERTLVTRESDRMQKLLVSLIRGAYFAKLCLWFLMTQVAGGGLETPFHGPHRRTSALPGHAQERY